MPLNVVTTCEAAVAVGLLPALPTISDPAVELSIRSFKSFVLLF